MRLTVLSVAFPFAPVRADTAGGAEQTVLRLDAALVDAGHRSIVVAAEGSAVAGELVEVRLPRERSPSQHRESAWVAWREAVEHALGEHRVDLVHMHGLDFDRYLPREGPPVLVTLHLPPSWYSPGALRPTRPATHLHCVSECQRRACPPDLTLLPTIENGVPLGPFRPRSTRRPFALALGRVCPEKGFHTALDAGDLAGVPVLIGGHVFPYPDHEAYFAREIAPRLHPPHRFLGRLDANRRRRLLKACRCLLVPSVAPETSSLVAMEALAEGIPVVAFPAGALPDIVEHGVTGWIVADAGEMAEAISRIDRLDPRACRRAAESRFSLERMAGEYLRLYEQLSGPRARIRVCRSSPCAESTPPALVVEEITDAADLERLAPEWHDLWRRDAAATPFQSPQWLIPWWRHIGRGDLWTLAVRESRARGAAGPLRALLPLYVYTNPGSATRELFPLGISTSDYLDGIFDVAHRAECAAAIVRRLETAQERWDACDLRQLRPGSPLLDASIPASWTSEVTPDEPCPVLHLPAGIPPKMLQNLRTYRRRAERAGSLQITTLQAEYVEETLADLFRLHRARWHARSAPGVFADDGVEAFHKEASPRLASADMLRLHVLRLDGRVAAAMYVLWNPELLRKRAYFYISGFEPSLHGLSPGTLLIGHAIQEATREHAQAFDFLRGRERYKYLWGAADTPTHRRRLWSERGPAPAPCPQRIEDACLAAPSR